jgi:hypothetical protein
MPGHSSNPDNVIVDSPWLIPPVVPVGSHLISTGLDRFGRRLSPAIETTYNEGIWAPAAFDLTQATELYNTGVRVPGRGLRDYNALALGGSSEGLTVSGGTGSLDWNSIESVQRFRGLASERLAGAQSRFDNITPANNFQISEGNPYSQQLGIANPYYSQGLGPKTYEGLYFSDQARDEIRWFEATERKFALREQELKGIANAPATEEFGAGTQGAYDAQQAGRAAQGVPFAQGARSAELLRQGQGPRVGGGAAQGGASRQANRARAAEGRRFASNDRTTGSSGGGGGGGGGSTATRRLRAANLMRQPLGAGSQSAAQLLG